jgi:uridine phosphorylase
MDLRAVQSTPIGLVRTDHAERSVFRPEGLLREARRQRNLPDGNVPDVCLLDPDGDVVRWLRQSGTGCCSESWACYHTRLWEIDVEGIRVGVVGNAVGAPFAVLVAEELFASGCGLIVSVTSAGQLDPTLTLPATILVDRALRGEGTSYAYLPPNLDAAGDEVLLSAVADELARAGVVFVRGGTWTTDAPFRETRTALDAAAAQGARAVEMEVAALYAFARACRRPVVCFALVTNQMAQDEGDFEKGADNGARHALALVAAAARGWREYREGAGPTTAPGGTPP